MKHLIVFFSLLASLTSQSIYSAESSHLTKWEFELPDQVIKYIARNRPANEIERLLFGVNHKIFRATPEDPEGFADLSQTLTKKMNELSPEYLENLTKSKPHLASDLFNLNRFHKTGIQYLDEVLDVLRMHNYRVRPLPPQLNFLEESLTYHNRNRTLLSMGAFPEIQITCSLIRFDRVIEHYKAMQNPRTNEFEATLNYIKNFFYRPNKDHQQKRSHHPKKKMAPTQGGGGRKR